jgi:ribonuclease HI
MRTAAYCDGACRVSNPGLCSCGWVLLDEKGDVVDWKGYFLGHGHTNNFAEYMGLVYLLEYLYSHEIKGVKIYSDSALVVNQVNQSWQTNNPDLKNLNMKAYGLILAGSHILAHVKGHSGSAGNEMADKICNDILDHNEEFYGKQE